MCVHESVCVFQQVELDTVNLLDVADLKPLCLNMTKTACISKKLNLPTHTFIFIYKGIIIDMEKCRTCSFSLISARESF